MKKLGEKGTWKVAEVEEEENDVNDQVFIEKFWREVVKILIVDEFSWDLKIWI